MKAILITSYNRTDKGEDLSHLTKSQRANLWIAKGHTGSSSKAIWAHMVGAVVDGHICAPLDPQDLNRCLLLLEVVPEWKARMHEMAVHGGDWIGLAARWGEIAQTFIDEVGINWCKGERAPKTYALMKEVTHD